MVRHRDLEVETYWYLSGDGVHLNAVGLEDGVQRALRCVGRPLVCKVSHLWTVAVGDLLEALGIKNNVAEVGNHLGMASLVDAS